MAVHIGMWFEPSLESRFWWRLVLSAIYLTVGLSVLAHGLTAAPLAGRYARWYEQHPREQAPSMESAPAQVTRPRGPAGHRTSGSTAPAERLGPRPG